MSHSVLSAGNATFGNSDGFFARLRRNVAEYRQYLRTLDELSSLDDRDLQDLGISRFDVKTIAWESVYRR
jgi:uncharacterized protein YjiS (DUF1127 family)